MHPKVFEWFTANIVAAAGSDVPMEVVDGATTRLTIGKKFLHREHGAVTAVFVAKSGTGLTASLAAGQRFADAMVNDPDTYFQTTLTEDDGRKGILQISNVGTPDPAPFEDGNWHLCSVVCAYTYDSVRGAA